MLYESQRQSLTTALHAILALVKRADYLAQMTDQMRHGMVLTFSLWGLDHAGTPHLHTHDHHLALART